MDAILEAQVRAELVNAALFLYALVSGFPAAATSHMIELRPLPSFASYRKDRNGNLILDTAGNRKLWRLDPLQSWLSRSEVERALREMPERLARLSSRIDRYTGRPGQLYYGPNLRGILGTRDDEVSGLTCVFADLDLRKAGLLEILHSGRLLEEVGKLVPAPSAIVDSGFGAHVYFLLAGNSPMTPASVSLWIHVVRGLARALDSLGADHKIANLSRILRLPGTLNRKPICRSCGAVDTLAWKRDGNGGWASCKTCLSTPVFATIASDLEGAFDVSGKVVRLVHFDPQVQYSLEELAEVVPVPPAAPPSARNPVPFSFNGGVGSLDGYPAFRLNAGGSLHNQTLAWMRTLRREGAGQDELNTAVEIARTSFPAERAHEPLQIARWVWANVRGDPPVYRSTNRSRSPVG